MSEIVSIIVAASGAADQGAEPPARARVGIAEPAPEAGAEFRVEVERFADRISLEAPVALIDNDAVLVLGTNVLDAFDRLEVLEATSEALINSRALGGAVPMSPETIAELEAAFSMPSRPPRCD